MLVAAVLGGGQLCRHTGHHSGRPPGPPSPRHSQDDLPLLVSLSGTFQWHRTHLQSGLVDLIIFLQKLKTQLLQIFPVFSLFHETGLAAINQSLTVGES